MEPQEKLERFERSVIPYMDAAYNLARWLARNDQDAQDIVQEAYLRAFRFFDGFRGGDNRAWLLRIVRNTFYTFLQRNRKEEAIATLDEELPVAESDSKRPDTLLLREADSELLRDAIEALSPEFREILVMRELEGLSYKEISSVAEVPLGTVMSRLARARQQLREMLAEGFGERGAAKRTARIRGV
ncbi:MAG TPA: sigma-70 family RNA polymerase sigma factor [Acidobacteriota bacterium]|nr:sigma-70 family RNA polymerase sigma factor [Acidobacteriota bacterium]